ncbi:MAG: PTS IIA-like nitrogen regulatory protein PtsN [Geminicoccaceae bacterium]
MVEIEDFLGPTNIRLGMTANSKAQLFQELAELAASMTELDPASVLAGLEQREKLGTTGIGEGVAIPHARLPGLGRLVGLFVRLAAPIEYDALDNAPVDLIFLLLAPEAASALQLKALARVARLLRDPELSAALRHEPSADALYELLRRKVPGQAA